MLIVKTVADFVDRLTEWSTNHFRTSFTIIWQRNGFSLFVNQFICEGFPTKAGSVVEREVVHHSGTKETPPEQEVLGSLLQRPTALLTGLTRDKDGEVNCSIPQRGICKTIHTSTYRCTAVTFMTLCSTTESNHSMKDSTVAFFLSSSFSSRKTVMESSKKNRKRPQYK